MNKLVILILFLISSIIGYYWKSENDAENKENFQNKTIKENYHVNATDEIIKEI